MASKILHVGELACQKNSFLLTLKSVVVSCAKVDGTVKGSTTAPKNLSSTEEASQYEIICEDSVLYPEGGGQLSDFGWLFRSEEALKRAVEKDKNAKYHPLPATPIENDKLYDDAIYVHYVGRVGTTCVIYTKAPLNPGEEVWQKIDWKRRQFQMEHHSGQHLVTSIFEESFDMRTLSFSLTEPLCYIILDVSPYVNQGKPNDEKHIDPAKFENKMANVLTKEKQISPHVIKFVENRCNELIRDPSRKVQIDLYASKEEALQDREGSAGRLRTKKIPDDVTGPIRTVSIHGLDVCTCCGTHVNHLQQLQVMHILPQQEVKNSTVKVYIATGNKALEYFAEMASRERQLVLQMAGCLPEHFVSQIQERSKTSVVLEKKVKQWGAELGSLQAEVLLSQSDKTALLQKKVFIHRRDDVELEYFTSFRSTMDRLGFAQVILVAAWSLDSAPGGKKSTPASQGQVMISTGAGYSAMPPKAKKGAAAEKQASTEVDPEKQKVKACFDKVCLIVQEQLGDIKGGTSPIGYRGKGSIKKWSEMEKAIYAAMEN